MSSSDDPIFTDGELTVGQRIFFWCFGAIFLIFFAGFLLALLIKVWEKWL